MHEWALAEAVLETVKKHAREHGTPDRPAAVRSVTVSFGELQKVDRGVFLDGLRVLLEQESFAEDAFVFEEEAASFRCTVCAAEWGFGDIPEIGEEEREAIHFMPEAAHAYMRCPSCGSPDFRVAGGRGVTIRALDLETRAAAGGGGTRAAAEGGES